MRGSRRPQGPGWRHRGLHEGGPSAAEHCEGDRSSIRIAAASCASAVRVPPVEAPVGAVPRQGLLVTSIVRTYICPYQNWFPHMSLTVGHPGTASAANCLIILAARPDARLMSFECLGPGAGVAHFATLNAWDDDAHRGVMLQSIVQQEIAFRDRRPVPGCRYWHAFAAGGRGEGDQFTTRWNLRICWRHACICKVPKHHWVMHGKPRGVSVPGSPGQAAQLVHHLSDVSACC